jgi:uncharacterized phiE125 gp8 family phage protein
MIANTAWLLDSTDTLITGPTREPLDLEEVRKQRRLTSTKLDTLLDTWIAAARQYFEEQTGRQLMTATWESSYAAFPAQRIIELPKPPLQAVLSVGYDDGAGGEVVVDPSLYTVSAPQGPHARRGRVVLPYGGSWPTTSWVPNSVHVRYLAGYGNTPSDVPEIIRVALMYLVGHYHRYSEEMQELKGNTSLAPISHGAKDIIFACKGTATPTIQMTSGVAVWPV